MKRTFAALAIWASCGVLAAQADDGRPSHEKLNNLGLASLRMADDQAGAQVRGKQFVHIIWTLNQSAGTVTNMDSDSQTLGRPLMFNQAPPGFIYIEQTPDPVVDIVADPPGFPAGSTAEIVSETNFRVFGGDATQAGPFLPVTPSFSRSPSVGFRSFRR